MISDGINKITSAGKEVLDNSGLDIKIAERKRDVAKLEENIGDLVFGLYCKDERELNEEIVKLCEKVRELKMEINKFEEEKRANSERGKTERNE